MIDMCDIIVVERKENMGRSENITTYLEMVYTWLPYRIYDQPLIFLSNLFKNRQVEGDELLHDIPLVHSLR